MLVRAGARHAAPGRRALRTSWKVSRKRLETYSWTGLWALILLASCIAAPAWARTPGGISASPEVVRLLDLIDHRARLMEDVARWKWYAQRPITDPAREQQVLAQASATAARSGLGAAGAEAFVAAQMHVSRSIQRAAFERFEASAPAPNGPDLTADLRPAISATTQALLETLPRVLPLIAQLDLAPALHARLAPLGASDGAVAELAAALQTLRAAPRRSDSTLAAIIGRGTLRVGTTFDYAPFSARTATGEAAGIDIDLARDLAAALEVELVLVPASWPTLTRDLLDGHFDIAMSGISRTLARARHGGFTAPYHVGGKTPVIRCTDASRYARFEDLDMPDVRAIVNPGGTNERFARARLEAANIAVFPDNRRIFTEIAEGRADVMFTDAIEVERVIRADPRLCAALPTARLTYQEKGLWLPREQDGAWRRFVDLWLDQLRGNGRLDATFRHHGATRGLAPQDF